MIRTALAAAMLAALAFLPVQAQAATVTAVTTADINLRAGPATSYPVVVVLPARAGITVHGCLDDYSWCDIAWGAERGWVSASYLTVIYRSAPVVITPVVATRVGVGVVVYSEAYWRRHYVGRPWYRHWHRYGPVTVNRSVTINR